MLVIGLTGGIGSGKTTVADMFARYGISIIDADEIARIITVPGTPAHTAILQHFGPDILTLDGSLDRGKLRDIIFNQPKERTWLERLLHPIILERMEKNLSTQNGPYCIAVIPLLMETDSQSFIDRVLVVDASEATQVERATLRDNTNREDIRAIIASQMPRKERLAYADDVINNDGSEDKLAEQVEKLHQKYLQLSQDK